MHALMSANDPKQTFSNLAGVFSHVTQKQRER